MDGANGFETIWIVLNTSQLYIKNDCNGKASYLFLYMFGEEIIILRNRNPCMTQGTLSFYYVKNIIWKQELTRISLDNNAN